VSALLAEVERLKSILAELEEVVLKKSAAEQLAREVAVELARLVVTDQRAAMVMAIEVLDKDEGGAL
jgi:hypothetical protein